MIRISTVILRRQDCVGKVPTMSKNKATSDLEFKSVKALIKETSEAWEKFKNHSVTNDNKNEDTKIFKREIYDEVKIVKNGSDLSITTRKRVETRSLERDLRELISRNDKDKTSGTLDYMLEYLKKIALLSDELLVPVLGCFKLHIKDLQTHIHMMETWLSEPDAVVNFLNKSFDVDLDKIEAAVNEDQTENNVPEDKTTKCGRCFKPLSDHTLDVDNGEVYLCSDEQESSFNNPSLVTLYKSHDINVGGQIDLTFTLCGEENRKKFEAALNNFIKIFKPVSQVVVKDAGATEVNGTYSIDGVHDNVKKYSRSGIYDGKPVTFSLYRFTYDNGGCEWYISIFPGNISPGTDKDMDFYCALATMKKNEMPPLSGWRSCVSGYGIYPGPRLLHKTDDTDEEV